MSDHPTCPACEGRLHCTSCEDLRPKAEKLDVGWTVLSPFGRWETVDKVAWVPNYGPVRVWTKETGPSFAWAFHRWDRVDAHPPATNYPGKPEVRIIDAERGDIRMYAIAISDTAPCRWVPAQPSILVEAGDGGRGVGWWVINTAGGEYTDRGYPAQKYEGLSKAQARSKVRELGRAHAKALKAKFTLPAK